MRNECIDLVEITQIQYYCVYIYFTFYLFPCKGNNFRIYFVCESRRACSRRMSESCECTNVLIYYLMYNNSLTPVLYVGQLSRNNSFYWRCVLQLLRFQQPLNLYVPLIPLSPYFAVPNQLLPSFFLSKKQFIFLIQFGAFGYLNLQSYV